MNSAVPSQDNLTLFETSKLILEELRRNNALQGQALQYQELMSRQLQELVYLVNGFTSGGASFNGYLPDAFVSAYLSILGPVLAHKIQDDEIGLEEMMKGGTMLARRLLEELSAYRSEQETRDVLSNALELMDDPWERGDADEEEEEEEEG
jgi:hypothetical protein